MLAAGPHSRAVGEPDGGPPRALPRAAYVHVPFCAHRCGYCNFTVVAGRDDLWDAYLQALDRELSLLDEPRPCDTLFIGGGTPTHLAPRQLDQLLSQVRRWFVLADGGEFSMEANPADVNPERMEVLARHGVNRISLGAQSFDPEKLRLLERDHGVEDIQRAAELARGRGLDLSLDLIFGTSGETLEQWERDLNQALALRPQHVSTYGLTVERGTSFWSRRLRGDLPPLAEELERSLYAAAIDRLEGTGFAHYEVSNFALPGHRCRHNETYWAAKEYYAAGPGAARYVDGRREVNHRSLWTWIKRLATGESPVAESECLSPEDRAREALVLGLRRLEGIDCQQFAAKTGYEVSTLTGLALDRWLELGLVQLAGERLRLTRQGLYVSDALWPEVLVR